MEVPFFVTFLDEDTSGEIDTRHQNGRRAGNHVVIPPFSAHTKADTAECLRRSLPDGCSLVELDCHATATATAAANANADQSHDKPETPLLRCVVKVDGVAASRQLQSLVLSGEFDNAFAQVRPEIQLFVAAQCPTNAFFGFLMNHTHTAPPGMRTKQHGWRTQPIPIMTI